MAKVKKILIFNLDDPVQEYAYTFLSKIPRKGSILVADLIFQYVQSNYNGEISDMSKTEALNLARFVKYQFRPNEISSQKRSTDVLNTDLVKLVQLLTSSASPLNQNQGPEPPSTGTTSLAPAYSDSPPLSPESHEYSIPADSNQQPYISSISSNTFSELEDMDDEESNEDYINETAFQALESFFDSK